MRLGAGRYGTQNDYDGLKRHPFFAGIDFDKVFLMKSPINLQKYRRNTMMQKVIDAADGKQEQSADRTASTNSSQGEDHLRTASQNSSDKGYSIVI